MAQVIKFPKIDFNGIKGILLDLDNTLYSYEECHVRAIERCYYSYRDQIYKKVSFDGFFKIYREKRNIITKELAPQGACRSRLFAFQQIFEEFDLNNNWELAAQYEEIYWNTFISNMTLAKDALVFLKECKKLKIGVCIVSDMTANIQIRKLQKLKVNNYIKYLVTSEEIGAEKPDPRIFQAALRKLKLESSEVIMIGDDDNKDIKGAEALNIKPYKIFTKRSDF